MSDNLAKRNASDDEVDLGFIFSSVKSVYNSLAKSIIGVFKFYFKHKFYLLGLIIIGALLGFFYENNTDKTYENELLVLPNFSSTNYVYNKVEAINYKIEAKDSVYLKTIFGKDYKNLKEIRMEPVVDIYFFLSKNETYKELFELLYEEEAEIDFIENPINSRNFKYHRIFIKVKGEENHEKISKTFLNYINQNKHFNELKVLSRESLSLRIQKENEIINQIDTIVKYSKHQNNGSLKEFDLSINDNQGLNTLLQRKKSMIENLVYLNVELINQQTILKYVDSNYKVLKRDSFIDSSKVKLFPILLIVLYSVFFLFRTLYLKYS